MSETSTTVMPADEDAAKQDDQGTLPEANLLVETVAQSTVEVEQVSMKKPAGFDCLPLPASTCTTGAKPCKGCDQKVVRIPTKVQVIPCSAHLRLVQLLVVLNVSPCGVICCSSCVMLVWKMVRWHYTSLQRPLDGLAAHVQLTIHCRQSLCCLQLSWSVHACAFWCWGVHEVNACDVPPA